MKRLIQSFVYWAFDRHCAAHHDGGFEVCRNPVCRLAQWVEQAVYHWLYPWSR